MPGPASDVIDGFVADARDPTPDSSPLTTGPVDDATGEFDLSGVDCGSSRVKAREIGEGEFEFQLSGDHRVQIKLFADCQIWVTHFYGTPWHTARRYERGAAPNDPDYAAAKAQLKARLQRSSAVNKRRAHFGGGLWAAIAGIAAFALAAAYFQAARRQGVHHHGEPGE